MAATHPMAARLGRLFLPDPRDAGFPLRAVTREDAPVPTERIWTPGPLLDQGQTPQCVGYSGRNLLAAMPDPIKTATPTGSVIYRGAQRYDGIAGPHDGSDDHGSMKYLKRRGLVASYHWAQSADEARLYVLTTGPVLFGTNWTEDMFHPDQAGYVHPTGKVAGGHEYCAIGYSTKMDAFIGYQTWGVWGTLPDLPGGFYLRTAHADALLHDQGDICACVKTAKG